MKPKAALRATTAVPSPWIARIPVLLLFGLLPFVFSMGGLDTFRLPKAAFTTLVVAGMLLSVAWRNRWDTFRFSRWSWEALLTGVTVFVGLHTLVSRSPQTSWYALLDLLPLVLLYFLLREPLAQDFQKFVWLLAGAVLAVSAVLLVLQYYGQATFMLTEEGRIVAGRRNPSGLIGEVNSGGFLFGLATIVMAYFVVVERRKEVRYLAGGILLLNLMGLAYSRTLTAVLGLAVSAVLWFAFHHWWYLRQQRKVTRRLWVFWLVLLFLLTGAVGVGLYSGVVRRLAGTVEQIAQGNLVTATAGRSPVWRMTLGMIRESPLLGTGLGTFGTEFFRYRVETEAGRNAHLLSQPGAFREVHNDYLQVWQELGIVPFLAFLALLVWPLVLAIRLIARQKDPALQYWHGLLAIGLVYTAFNCLAFFPLRIAVTAAFVVLLAACLRSCQNPQAEKVVRRPNPGGLSWTAWLAMLSVAAVCIVLAVREVRIWNANFDAGIAARLLEQASSGQFRANHQRVLADQAAARLEKVEGLAAEIPEILTLKGAAFMLRGRYQDAVEVYQEAIRFIPSPESYTNLAAALVAAGQRDQADHCLEVALKYDPGYGKAIEIREFLSRQPKS